MIIELKEPVPCEVYHKDRWQKALFTHRDFKQDPDTLDWHDDLIIKILDTGEQVVLPNMNRLCLDKGDLFTNYDAKSIELSNKIVDNLTEQSKKDRNKNRRSRNGTS